MEKTAKKEILMTRSFIKFFRKNLDINFLSLIDLGSKGHYPLFSPEWFHHIFLMNHLFIQEQDIFDISEDRREIFEKILICLSSQNSLDNKKIKFFSFSEKDRVYFTRVFLQLVESKILDQRPYLH